MNDGCTLNRDSRREPMPRADAASRYPSCRSELILSEYSSLYIFTLTIPLSFCFIDRTDGGKQNGFLQVCNNTKHFADRTCPCFRGEETQHTSVGPSLKRSGTKGTALERIPRTDADGKVPRENYPNGQVPARGRSISSQRKSSLLHSYFLCVLEFLFVMSIAHF